jgi:hypothetical protein
MAAVCCSTVKNEEKSAISTITTTTPRTMRVDSKGFGLSARSAGSDYAAV